MYLVHEYSCSQYRKFLTGVRVREGTVAALADFSVDYSFGPTDEQLDLHIRCAIDTMVSALSWMDTKYPNYADNE